MLACCFILVSCAKKEEKVSENNSNISSGTEMKSQEELKMAETENNSQVSKVKSSNSESISKEETEEETKKSGDKAAKKDKKPKKKAEKKAAKKDKDSGKKAEEKDKAEETGGASKDKAIEKDKNSGKKAEKNQASKKKVEEKQEVPAEKKTSKNSDLQDNKNTVKEEKATINASGSFSAFKVGGRRILINKPFSAYKSLGKEDNLFTAPSCAFQGKTNIYEYSGYTVSVVEEPKKEGLVFSVLLTDESTMTGEGIRIGDSIDKVKKTYGKPSYTTEAAYIYRNGDVELIFIYDEDGITSIEYRSTTLEKTDE